MGLNNDAMIAAGGYNGTANQAVTEQYNGTSWTEVNYGRYGCAAAGTAITAGLIFGGENSGMPAEQQNAESWNGSAWTEVADMSTTRSWVWSGGTSTDALVSGGQPQSSNTETFDGTSWSEQNNLSAARGYASGKCGTTSTSCMWVSGAATSPPTGKTTSSEEWTLPDFAIKTVTQS